MRKAAKIWLVAAAGLVLLGLGMMVAALASAGWDFIALDTAKYETNTHVIDETFHSISMETDTADIVFAPAADGVCKVVCYEQADMRHTAAAQNKTLVIDMNDTREWYDHITFFAFGTPKITVYLPQAEYEGIFIKESTGDIEIPADFAFESVEISTSTGDVSIDASASGLMKITTNTGDIRMDGVSAGTLALSVSTGKIVAETVDCAGDVAIRVSTGDTFLTDVCCAALLTDGSTGDIQMKNVIAAEAFSIERSTGRVTFEQCDAAEIFVQTDTGDVRGILLSDKVFLTETDTGDVDVPRSITGGRCEIITNTGDIELRINQ